MSRPLTLVGMREISEMSGIERSTLRAWKTRGKLPEPVADLAMGPVWERSQIEDWLAYRAEVGLDKVPT